MNYTKIPEYRENYHMLFAKSAIERIKSNETKKKLEEAKRIYFKSCYDFYLTTKNDYDDFFKKSLNIGISPLTILECIKKYMIEYLEITEQEINEELLKFFNTKTTRKFR